MTWKHSLVHGFGNLTRFAGRDSRSLFWPYVGTIVAGAMIASFAAMAFVMGDTLSEMQRVAAQHPEAVTVTQSATSYSMTVDDPTLMSPPPVGSFLYAMMAVSLVVVLLLAAAVTRRLHDTTRRGFWGLVPIVFLAIGMVLMPGLFQQAISEGMPDPGLFLFLMLNNMIYMASLIVLIILLCQPTKVDAD